MENLTAMPSEAFLTALASAEPVPGGGGGAAMAGALAAALSSMVANLTIGKEKFAAQEEEVQEFLQQAEVARQRLLQLVQDDAAVFGSFMSCYKLPKDTSEEKAARTAAIRNAAKQAAGVPLEIARTSVKVAQLAERLTVIGNPGVITDGACSALLARAALRCAVYNVRINLGLTKDEEYNSSVEAELELLEAQALAAEEGALKTADEALA